LEDYQKKYFLITYIRTLKEELSNCDAKKLYDCNPFAFEDFEITREEFEQSTSKIFDKFQKILIKSKEEIEKFGFKIDKIILAGGASQMPRITEIANDVFEGSLILDKDALLDPFESIAKGASLYLDYKE
jgi:molecular chaperone DnaK (HSP70)